MKQPFLLFASGAEAIAYLVKRGYVITDFGNYRNREPALWRVMENLRTGKSRLIFQSGFLSWKVVIEPSTNGG